MGIQDDIFDVKAALEGKPESEAFNRIYQRFADLEVVEQRQSDLLVKIHVGGAALLQVISGGDQ